MGVALVATLAPTMCSIVTLNVATLVESDDAEQTPSSTNGTFPLIDLITTVLIRIRHLNSILVVRDHQARSSW